MYTHIHTIEWNHLPQYSSGNQNYFLNIDGHRIVAELTTKMGNEYYLCSEIQAQAGTLGFYAGCTASDAKRMVQDHEHETEHSFSLNDQTYLD